MSNSETALLWKLIIYLDHQRRGRLLRTHNGW